MIIYDLNQSVPTIKWMKYTSLLRNIPIILLTYIIVSIQNNNSNLETSLCKIYLYFYVF